MLVEQQENKRRLQQLRKYDDTPERIIPTLLSLNSGLCIEISTILYEEFTFQVHIHSDGVELLGFDRIPTLENWGAKIEKTMGAFKSEKPFCFHRMKHLEFVYFGGNPSDRLASLRMRESTRKLVDMLMSEDQGLSSVVVRYEYEKFDEGQEHGLRNAVTDELGNFWSVRENSQEKGVLGQSSRAPRSSIMLNVYSVELVCAPLRMLRNVSRIEMQFPEEIRGDLQLAETAVHMAKMMSGTSLLPETLHELMREEMIMDARRDRELSLAGAGGYYKPKRKDCEADFGDRGLLVPEEDMEEDGLVAPFGDGEVGYEKVYGSLQELADDFGMEDVDVEQPANRADGFVKVSEKGSNSRKGSKRRRQ
jgi:phage terminase large subunit-like protein